MKQAIYCFAMYFAVADFYSTAESSFAVQTSSGGDFSLDGAIQAVDSAQSSGGFYSIRNASFSEEIIIESIGSPTIRVFARLSDLVLTWSAMPGQFTLEESIDLVSWQPLSANQTGSGADVSATVPIESQKKFLRLKSAQ